MRFIVEPIRNDGKFLGAILLAHPIEAIQKSLNYLLVTLIIVLAVLIVPSILGGLFIARKIIRPITLISSKMSEISSERLDLRLDDPGSDDEIANLAKSFNDLLSRLQDSFQRERQFIGDVAHELKTPIATLRSGIELSLSKPRDKKEYLKSLNETLIDTNRLSSTVNNILDLAWLGAENIDNLVKPINLTLVLRELQEITLKLATKKHIKVKFNLESNVQIEGVENKLARALLNILDNAIKFTPSDGVVGLKLRRTNHHVVIQIKDNGIGITKEELPHIFKRFYRGNKTSKTFGSGLGLAITEGIIKLHRGNIAISSIPSKGTTIKISLPLSST
jgi:signal transduction histidine kinase